MLMPSTKSSNRPLVIKPVAAAVRLNLEYTVSSARLPQAAFFAELATQCLKDSRAHAEINLRITGKREMQRFNQQFRNINRPTNVLSFPAEGLEAIAPDFLGDIVICAPLVSEQARQQHKKPRAHWAHLWVHGILHLLGFDHQQSSEATVMELMECRILAAMGYPNPYEIS